MKAGLCLVLRNEFIRVSVQRNPQIKGKLALWYKNEKICK